MGNSSCPVRILHVTEMLSAAGIESFIMNIYRHIDRKKVQFDFLVLRNRHEFYDEEIKELGGIKYWIHSSKKNTFFRIHDEARQLEDFLKLHQYSIVHIHYTTPLRAPYLKACIKADVKTRIYHSHSAYVSGKNPMKIVIYNFMKKKITKWATDYFACSKVAADWMFEKKLIIEEKVKVIYNGIDTNKFAFNEKYREEIRKKYNVENKYILIHTGRFMNQKNHKFLIKVFRELKNVCPDAVLFLMGTGELLDSIKDQVNELCLDKDVIFLGVRADVNRYLCAADCYIMPSLYEGLPVAAVEAECAGLPCVFSTNITKEVSLIKKTSFISLKAPIENWVKQILTYKGDNRKDESRTVSKIGYDVQNIANNMQHFYLSR